MYEVIATKDYIHSLKKLRSSGKLKAKASEALDTAIDLLRNRMSEKIYCATLYILRRQVRRALSSLVQNKQFIRSSASLFGIVTDNY